jgi:hypothetical protein
VRSGVRRSGCLLPDELCAELRRSGELLLDRLRLQRLRTQVPRRLVPRRVLQQAQQVLLQHLRQHLRRSGQLLHADQLL